MTITHLGSSPIVVLHLPSDAIWPTLAQGQVNTPTSGDLSSKVFFGIHLRAMYQEFLMNLIRYICSEIILLKLLPHLPDANGLTPV